MLFQFFGADQAQHQFLDVEAISQELRFTSPAENRVRWIAGVYGIATDRFISTGNVFDLGTGVVPQVRRQPLPLFNPQFTYLARLAGQFRLGGVRQRRFRPDGARGNVTGRALRP